MAMKIKGIRVTLAAGAAALVGFGGAHAQQLDQALQVARQSTQEGARAQAQIDDLADAADNLEREYLAVREQIESQRVALEQQRVFLRSQENELVELNRQLERVGTIERDLTPMLLEMFVHLEDFVRADLPFQMDMRLERLDRIQRDLGDAGVSPAEKYRVILNAYEIESAYGRSLRTYSEEVEVDGVPKPANVLQIGRVALIRDIEGRLEMLTKDNPEWRPVPGGMANYVQRAFRIANEVTTPEVFVAPLPGPVSAR
jgi:multidrug efflux pump subunit AcrA (membrane-fusion protein)